MDGKIKNVTVSYKISLAEGVAYVKLAYDLDVTYKVKGDYIPASCISNINDITFVYWGVPGVGGFKITYDVELSGSFSGVQSWHKELGMSVSRSDGFRLIRDFKTKTFTMVAEATFQVGFKAKFGVTELPAFNAYAYASMGSVGKLKIQTYQDDAAPQKCMHFAAYLYAECGLQGSAKLIIKETVSLKYEIFNAKIVPFAFHTTTKTACLSPSARGMQIKTGTTTRLAAAVEAAAGAITRPAGRAIWQAAGRAAAAIPAGKTEILS